MTLLWSWRLLYWCKTTVWISPSEKIIYRKIKTTKGGDSRWSDIWLADPVGEWQAALLLFHILSFGYLLLYRHTYSYWYRRPSTPFSFIIGISVSMYVSMYILSISSTCLVVPVSLITDKLDLIKILLDIGHVVSRLRSLSKTPFQINAKVCDEMSLSRYRLHVNSRRKWVIIISGARHSQWIILLIVIQNDSTHCSTIALLWWTDCCVTTTDQYLYL